MENHTKCCFINHLHVSMGLNCSVCTSQHAQVGQPVYICIYLIFSKLTSKTFHIECIMIHFDLGEHGSACKFTGYFEWYYNCTSSIYNCITLPVQHVSQVCMGLQSFYCRYLHITKQASTYALYCVGSMKSLPNQTPYSDPFTDRVYSSNYTGHRVNILNYLSDGCA